MLDRFPPNLRDVFQQDFVAQVQVLQPAFLPVDDVILEAATGDGD
jgi:hypothetical protein